jgi:glycosyltransferase involved in cell wall biosynthesis
MREDRRVPRKERYREEYFNGVRFIFIKATPPYFENDWRRIFNMLTFAYRAFVVGCQQKEQPHVIIGSTPHPFCALAALSLAWRKKARFFLELHDLWTEYLVDTGKLSRRNPIVVAATWMNKFLYQKSEIILTLWPGMDKYLERFGIPPNKVVWMPLGIDFDTVDISDAPPSNHSGLFSVVCMGRLGPASNIDEILQAANILQNDGHNKIRFILLGSGPEEGNLVRYAEDHSLRNVEFRGLVPKQEIPKHLAEADACIGGLPDVATYKKYGTIPTKVLEYLTSNRPTIFMISVENSLVQQANAGIVVPPGNPAALAKAILNLTNMSPQERALMAQNGLKYVKENHNLKMIAEKLESLL